MDNCLTDKVLEDANRILDNVFIRKKRLYKDADKHPALKDLFKRSDKLQRCMVEILGGSKKFYNKVVDKKGCQIVIRDLSTITVNRKTFVEEQYVNTKHIDKNSDAYVAKWHVDGCNRAIRVPKNKIHNFDLIVGFYLNDITEKNSGELCVYTDSIKKLPQWLNNRDNFKKVMLKGDLGWDQSILTDLHHVNCKKGSVVIMNHMCAHTIAPNFSDNYRRAVYIRFTSGMADPTNTRGFYETNVGLLRNPQLNYRI